MINRIQCSHVTALGQKTEEELQILNTNIAASPDRSVIVANGLKIVLVLCPTCLSSLKTEVAKIA